MSSVSHRDRLTEACNKGLSAAVLWSTRHISWAVNPLILLITAFVRTATRNNWNRWKKKSTLTKQNNWGHKRWSACQHNSWKLVILCVMLCVQMNECIIQQSALTLQTMKELEVCGKLAWAWESIASLSWWHSTSWETKAVTCFFKIWVSKHSTGTLNEKQWVYAFNDYVSKGLKCLPPKRHLKQ